MTTAQSDPIAATTDFTIRRATLDDLPVLTEFWTALYDHEQRHGMKLKMVPAAASLWADQMRARLPQPSTLALIGLHGETPAGFLTGQLKVIPPLYESRMGGIFQDMYTLPEFRRQGLARSLVQAGIGQFTEMGAQSIEIQIAHLNERSLAFWTSLGWEHEVFQMRNFIAPTHRSDDPPPCSDA